MSFSQGVSFGPRTPPLTEVIKNILVRYPDGGQILKELIQNADDAGATNVKFLYDNRHHGTQSLQSPELARFQGPALYCHNNATFKEDDWEGIQNLMRSNKKDDPLKVGRFGIGFNSVYHITDLPGIVSKDSVGFLDPHETYFGRGMRGQLYDVRNNLLDPSSRDQFAPFDGIFGCDLGNAKSYDGTLFRFPLRTTPSELSKKNYTKEMVDNLFESLRKEVSVILLFLKSVQSISVHERREDGEIKCVFKVEVAEETREEVERKREEFLKEAKEPNISESKYVMNIRATFGSNTQTFHWLIVNQIGSTEKRIAELAEELHLLPWVGIAVPLDANTSKESTGRIFCFLPLPPDVDCQTGLPVHVHGYFGVTDNRRGLVWSGDECQNTGTGEWNELLLKEIAVEVYLKIFEALVENEPNTGIAEKERSQLVYSTLPAPDRVRGHWNVLSEHLFTKLVELNKKLFFAHKTSGRTWIALNEGLLDRLQDSQIPRETQETILKILLSSSRVVITGLPQHVLEIVARYFSPPRDITPGVLRGVLRNQDISRTPREEKLLLLEYVLGDDPSTDLSGVPLLPLASGEFSKFCPNKHAKTPSVSVFVPNQVCMATLLPNMKHRFLDETLPNTLTTNLCSLAAEDSQDGNPTQLVPLTKEIVLQNLRSSLPSEWFSGEEKVEWIEASSNHPPESWFKAIWDWIHLSFPDSLSPFKGIPLIQLPASRNKCLGVLSPASKFIFDSDGSGNTLPLQVTSLLAACGCTVIHATPSYLYHPDIKSYIAPPTPVGTITVLKLTTLDTLQEHIKRTDSNDRRVIREFFCRLPEEVSIDQKKFLLQLSLFDTLNGSATPVKVNGQALDVASPQFNLPDDFKFAKSNQLISSTTPNSHQLLTLLNVEILKPADVLRRYLFPDIQAGSAYTAKETSGIMLWIIKQMFVFQDGFQDEIKVLSFVPTDEGELKKPSELYDPIDALLFALFLGESTKFPTGDFADENMVPGLKELGLRKRDMLTATELLEVAVNIASDPVSQTYISKAEALVKILEDNPAYLNQCVDGCVTLKDKLLHLNWLPRAKHPPKVTRFPKFMPFYDCNSSFFSPTQLRSKSQALLVGSSMPILDTEMSEELQDKLGLTSDPPLNQVVSQLEIAVRSWREQHQTKVGSQLEEMLVVIYLHLSRIPNESVSTAINNASLKQWIWQGTGFCAPAQLALEQDFPLDLRPQLFLLPKVLNNIPSLKQFFLGHGVRERFFEGDILGVLDDLRNKHEKLPPEINASSEVENDLKLCRSILEWVVKDGKTLELSLQEKVFVPVQSDKDGLVLESCKKCTFCDQDWLRRGGSELDIPEDYSLIHESVPVKVARLLGVPALSTCLVSAETLGFEFEQTGPHEPITTRLNNILKEYKEGVGVFKELIQNADDAGASKVRFLVDWRHGPKQKLLSPKMAECQGPALWAYNDAVFTDKDFENINKLAGATKVEDLAKVGRFGLGFNAVYHLTDVPSFVSREYFVMFDPNVHHLQSHIKDKSRPGIRINLATNPRPLSSFKDQFQPYHDIFDCDTQCTEGEKFHCKGTLFRFPFRTLRQASESEICQSVYNEEKVKNIVSSLKESASVLLLYTQHVNDVELYELEKDNTPNTMQLVLSIKKNVPLAVPFIQECSDWWKGQLTSEGSVATSPRRLERLTIDVNEMASDLVGKTEKLVRRETWLLSSCGGTGSSTRLALNEGRDHGLLPCAGAAAKLSGVSGNESMDACIKLIPEAVSGEVFCFLPLSIATGFPVHINGYFAITSNRRGIWERSTAEHSLPIEVQWNESLMEDALPNAYVHLLEETKQLYEQSLQPHSYYEIWPCYKTLHSHTWEKLVTSFYTKLVDEALPIFWGNGKWLDIHSGYVLDEDLHNATGAVETLIFLGENVFHLPKNIRLSFAKSGQDEALRKRTLTFADFLKKFFFPNITTIPQDLQDSIVWFGLECISHGRDELVPLFAENAFVLTKEGELKKPSELYNPDEALLVDLYSEEKNKFPNNEFTNRNFISTLIKLGLRTRSMLTALELHEVAANIASFPVLVSSISKVQALVRILEDKPVYLNQIVDDGARLKDKLLHLKWLPRMKSPSKSTCYPEFMPWYDTNSALFAPTELRAKNLILLIGSSMPVLAIEMKDELQEELGLTSDPPVQLVIDQLRTAVDNWQEQHHKGFTFKFQEILVAIYNHLSQKSNEVVTHSLNVASLKEWIWQGRGFCSPEQIALENVFPLDLQPQLFLLPDELKTSAALTSFFLRQGVRRKFSEEDVLGVLATIGTTHASLLPGTDQPKQVESDLKLCRSILEWVVQAGETLPERLQEKVLVPVQTSRNVLILEPCKKCAYCDRDWLRQGGSDLDIPGDNRLIHESITEKVASLLGVPALSTCLVSAETLGFEQTGPHEPITTRLNNILKEYKEGVGVFKELIQNADDAGASKVRFLVDWRHGPKQKLLSPKMAECQGPALWAYNNAVFTDKDFENINKLAGATKVEDLAKVGRFGLGFNAVYHLTDVPSFVSREYFVMFDPNVHHLQSHIKDKSRPGIRINLATNPRPLSAFEDQFQPYHDIFDCDTQCTEGEKFHCEGTLFRFPFRTLRQASESEICKSVYNEEKVKNIVSSLKESASVLLLYTQHVNDVELYELEKDNTPNTMQLVLSMKKNVPPAVPFIQECSDWWKGQLTSEGFVAASPRRLERLTIDVNEMASDLVGKTEGLMQRETWLLSSCGGTGSSTRLALNEGRDHGLLPCAGVATKLSGVSRNESMDACIKLIPEAVSGEAFCFLPLSIATGFPVHINGYFAITSNRRGIWERNTADNSLPIEVQWNESLMEDALPNAYVHLLEETKQLYEQSLQPHSYYEIWPCYKTLHSNTWEKLVTSFYTKLVDEALPIFWGNGKWLDIHSGYVPDEDLHNATGAVETLIFLGENVFHLTPNVRLSFAKSGQDEALRKRTLTFADFLKKFFFPNITTIPQELQYSIVWFGLECISHGRDELVPLFAENAFVLTKEGELKKPSELYNPDEALLVDLYSEEKNKFPNHEFANRNFISTLIKLGLRTRSMLTALELHEVAANIASFPVSVSSISKVQALVRILEDKPVYLNQIVDDGARLKDKLLHLKWLPRMKSPSKSTCYPEFMPWYDTNSALFAPTELRAKNLILLIGSSMPVLAIEMKDELQEELGLTSDPPVQLVIDQLRTAVDNWQEQHHKGFTFKFQEILVAIYNHLSQKSNEVVTHSLNVASLKEWIWQGRGFCSPEQIALENVFPLDLQPQLFLLPDELKTSAALTSFFLRQGVRRKFSEEDVLGVLATIRNTHASLLPGTDQPKQVESDLKLCRSILEWVVQAGETLPERLQEKVLVPVQTSRNVLILEPCKKCAYCDRDWLRQGGSDLDIPGDNRLIHESITEKVASLLGVPALSTCLVSAETLGFEQTGPHEPITTRLNNILKEYKEGVGVFKELIQNADDAGASKVRFLVDWRHGPKQKLLSPKMAECQGPALWAYNNAVFTDKDFENINKLAGATKVEDLAKVGRFGLGFNAVYHLTDVPSFVSREYFVMFDPNVHHLQSHIKDKSRPGIRINLATNPRPLSAFEDQFQPYHDIFDCDTQCTEGEKFHCEGTLFRFPFRTLRQASESEICKSVYNEEKVKEIVSSLKKSASLLLLYSQHINDVELYELEKDNTPNMKRLVLSIKKSVPRIGEGLPSVPFIEECSHWWERNLTSKDSVTDGPVRSELLTIDVSEVASDHLENPEQMTQRETWLLNSCVGTDSSIRLAKGEGRKHGLLPCAGAAAKLSQASNQESTDSCIKLIPEAVSGEAFCFLPLSIATGFPVHINGYFAITSNRRGIWERSTADHSLPIEVQWNESLMEDALPNAYVHMLEETKKLYEQSDSLQPHSYYEIWPCYNTLHSNTWKKLVTSFYTKLVKETLPIFWGNGKWLDIHSGYVLEEDLHNATGAVETLIFLGENVFHLPPNVRSSFAKSGQDETLRKRTLTLAYFFKEFFFPNITTIPQELQDSIVWFGLECISHGRDEFVPLFAENAFVLTKEGELKKPSELYDPNEALLVGLYSEEKNKFPNNEFTNRNFISTLIKLGLRTRSMLTALELHEVAANIASFPVSESSISKVQALVKILEDEPVYLNQIVHDGATLKDKLLHLKWLPRMKSPSKSTCYPEFMPWYDTNSALFAPTELRAKNLILLIGSSMPVLDIEMKDELQEELGLTSDPPVQLVIDQLRTAVDNWKEQHHKGFTFKFQEILVAIYNHVSHKSNEVVTHSLNVASLKEWIWQGRGFCSPEQIALENVFALDLQPQLFFLPEDLKTSPSLTSFFLRQGMRRKFSEEDVLGVLATIRNTHASLLPGTDESKQVESDLKLCRSILEWVVKDGETLPERLQEKILVPVQTSRNVLILEPCKKCAYFDRDWLRQGGSDLDIPGDNRLIHESITEKVASLLGVPALSTCLVSAETLGFEQTGPHEPITTRLNNILKEYKEGVGVFKELIQNADDAGASQVRFLVDWRHGPKQKLLSPKMAECQGPALWAYNDAVFTDKDFKNINKLAGATKVEDLAKIGRFGLGFNAVYHLTDVPSFVSREYFVMFDPNVHHLQSHIKDKSRPGIRINLATNPRPLSAFEDQFQPYHEIFDCDTQCTEGEKFHCKGTLFRFPLRTLRQASESEICQSVYNEEKVEEIVSSLKESASLLLLYTQHVKDVELYELEKDNTPNMKRLILSIKKSVPQTGEGLPSVPFIQECSHWWERNLTSKDSVTDGPVRSELLTIDVSEVVSDHLENPEQMTQRETWLLNSCVGTNSSIRLAKGEGRKHGLLPCAGAAAKLSQASNQATTDACIKLIPEAVSGEAFCFLPLSIATGFPVHINGYFAITSNRRGIWERSTADHSLPIEVQWNESLMDDALARAYLQLLEEMKRLSEEEYLQYDSHQKLWPCYDEIQSHTWETLVKSVYTKIVEESLPLLWSNGKWLDIHSGYILEESLSNAPGTVEILNHLKQNVFHLTADVCASISKSGHKKVLESRTLTLENFFKEFFFPNITTIPPNLRDPIVVFGLDCILSGGNMLVPLFQENACINCSADGDKLVEPCKLINPEGAAASLFSPEDHRFPVGEEFLKSNRLHVLEQLGMVKDKLSWHEICGRAESVEKIAEASYERGLELARHLIKYLNKNTEGNLNVDDELITALQSSNFLPFMSEPPHQYGLSWKGTGNVKRFFHSPKDLFLQSDANLVGSCFLVVDESEEKGCGLIDPEIKELLGFPGRRPRNDQVLQQLDAAINSWSDLNEEERKVKKRMVESVSRSIYKHFDDFFRDQLTKTQENEEDTVSYLKEELDSKRWLFLHGTFVPSDKVACKCMGNYPPYLYGLPEDYNDEFKNLLQVVGVKESFERTDFIRALYSLKVSKAGVALTEDELNLAIRLVNELKDIPEDLLKEEANRLSLPDAKKVLCVAGELTINTTPWLKDRGDASEVHKDVNINLAFELGAKSLQHKRLKKYSNTLGSSFGQQEELTDRLKNILKAYRCDSGILKELVQNADDAQASEIHFIYDTRDLPWERVFQKNAKEVQGPALCVYNNRPFSDKDLEGIQKLGIGSKSDNPETTGQYGVGFNAVYHLTDCPSFLSNDDTLCVLDPHCRYAPEATSESPGEKFKPIDDAFREDFSDSFLGYLGGYFNLKGSTMFRLPLRTYEQSQSSQISQTDANAEISSLFNDFKFEAKKSLLFLNYVKKISLSTIDKNGKLKSEYEVSSIMDVEDEKKRQNISSLVKTYKNKPSSDVPWQGETYPMILSDSYRISEEWLVHQCFGVRRQCEAKEITDGRPYGLLPRGGIAALVSSTREKSSPSYQPRHIAYCFLPLPVYISLPVHVNGHFALDPSRRALWNSNTEPKDSLTKWNDDLKSHVLAPGYAALIVEARNYIPHSERDPNDKTRCCFPSKVIAEIGLSWYHKLFPNLSNTKDEWRALAIEVYRFLGETKAPVLPVVVADEADKDRDTKESPRRIRNWLPPQGGLFIKKSESDEALRKVLLLIRLPLLVMSPFTICDDFKEAEVSSSSITPRSVIDALRTFQSKDSLCEMGELPSKLEDTMVRTVNNLKNLFTYCSKMKENFASLLNGLPLLLTADGQLRVFDENNPVYCSKFSDLFPRRIHSFVHPELVNNLLRTIWNEKDQPTSRALQDLSVSSLAAFIPDVFPVNMRGAKKHLSFPDDAEVLSEEWLKRLWEFLQDHAKPKEGETQISLKILGEWPIIPTTEGKLVTIDNAKTVFDMTESEKESSGEKKVRECLKKLGCPTLNKDITFGWIPTGSKNQKTTANQERKIAVTDPYVAHPYNVAHILQVLDYMWNAKTLDVTKLCESEIRDMLLYFQDDYRNLTPKENYDEILKNLPLYKAVDNTHYSLSSFSSYALVPSGVPVDEIEVLQRLIRCLFLHSDASPALDALYEGLGAGAKRNVSRFYTEFILPNFSIFGKESRMEYLTHIRKEVLPTLYETEEKEAFLSYLKNALCIPDADGRLHCAREFYDPRNSVFKIMLEMNEFPPDPFQEKEWLEFLAKIGLKTDVNETEFLKFCREVASVGNRLPLDEVNTKRSKQLVQYLFDKAHLHGSSFLTSVSTIKFIASEKVELNFLAVHKQHQCNDENQQPPFLQFAESVPWEYKTLVWSSATLLPQWAQPKKELLCQLKIRKFPCLSSVISHLQNISTSLHAQSSKKEEALQHSSSLKNIMTNIYEFFHESASTCNEQDISDNCSQECKNIGDRLKTTPCILVENGKLLVRGDQLSFKDHEKKSLHPFFYAVPSVYGKYEHIFKRLGATQKPTSIQLAKVFKEMRDRCKEAQMNPEFERKARNAMFLFFGCLLEETGGGKTESKISKLTELYLPSEDKRLVKSTDLVCKVPPRHSSTVAKLKYPVLFSLEKCELSRSREDEYLQAIPKHLRPIQFSKIVCEGLDPSCRESSCQLCREDDICEFIEKHIKILKSKEFQEGLVRLLKHQKNSSELTNDEVEKLSRLGSPKVEIKCMESIKVRLILAETDQPLENSSAKRSSYVVKQTDSWMLYIQHETGGANKQSVLSKSVNKILDWLLKDECLLAVTDMLSCESPSQISGVLNDHDIQQDFAEDNLKLGRDVPAVFYYLMQQNPLFVLYEGEIVAYGVEERQNSDESSDEDVLEGDGPLLMKYVLAKVIRCVNSKRGQNSYDFEERYLVDLGSETKEVSVLDLYKFYQNNPDENLTTEIVPYTGDTARKPNDVEGAKLEIREALRAAWRLSPDMRRKVIKRLYLRWHPDKNPNNVEFATEMTIFLRSEIARMEEEERRLNTDSPVHFDLGDLFHECDNTARRDHETYRNFHSFYGGPPSMFSETFDYTNPDVPESRRWLLQADSDLEAAEFLLSARRPFNALACFLSHQIVEKSLKAALYAKCGLINEQLHTHDVYQLARNVTSLTGAPSKVVELALIVANYYLPTRYPNRQPRAIVPANAYSDEQSNQAVQSAKEILKLIQTFIGV